MKHLVSAALALALSWLSLPAVQGASVNVALDAPAYANGPIYGNAYPALLVNGDKANVMHGNVAISPGFAYWIDLRNTHTIDQIKLYPRQDPCCPERLSNFHVSVHEDEFTDTVGFELWGGD